MKQYPLTLFIFRRDLRLQDNLGLMHALSHSEQVIPCFILDPVQLEKHPYKSEPGLKFMLNALKELNAELEKKGSKLHLFKGKPTEVIQSLLDKQSIQSVMVNRDYTPYSRLRDGEIHNWCQKNKVDFQIHSDALLTEPESVMKSDGTPYSVFGAFYKKASTQLIPLPKKNTLKNYSNITIKPSVDISLLDSLLKNQLTDQTILGGRKQGLKLLSNIPSLKEYDKERDIPSLDATSHLSAHHKFGTISIRESYHPIEQNLGKDHRLLTELYWRDFFTHIGYHFPYVFGHAFNKKYELISWSKNKSAFESWCRGKTGFPLVDAGMRELNQTGYMHNRVRMVVASFLVKDLHIDWRWGERYFAQHLIDYDPCVNNGNWQWAASTGCDAQPYFRIFNPWRQQERFDPECAYIKKWVPELFSLPKKEIHNLWNSKIKIPNYPSPICDHKEESKKAIALFKIH